MKNQEVNDQTESIANIRKDLTCALAISKVKRIDEYTRSAVNMELDLAPGESRGYWRYHTPGKWFNQAKAIGKTNNEKATLRFNSGAEVSIIDTTFSRKAMNTRCTLYRSQRQPIKTFLPILSSCLQLEVAPKNLYSHSKIMYGLAGTPINMLAPPRSHTRCRTSSLLIR